MCEKYQTAESEDKLLDDFVKSHPFPSYKAIDQLLNNSIKNGDSFAMDLIAEFGQLNYKMMKLMYENRNDTKIINDCASAILKKGGSQALNMNLYTINRVCCYLCAKSKKKYTEYEQLLIAYINKDISRLIDVSYI